MRRLLIAFPVILGMASVACSSSSNKGPEVASATDQTSYAATYPSRVDALNKQVEDQEADAKNIMASWEKLPADTGNTKDLDVRSLFEKADKAGKSQGYASERRDLNGVKQFYNEEKDEIGRRVAGTVEYQAQQKGCGDKQLGGAAAYGVKDAIDKRIEKRLRASNEAQMWLEEEGYRVDKPVADKLEKQLDDVATASFIVHIGVIETRQELAERQSEASKVSSTLDDAIKSENEKLADPKRPDASKQAIKARVTELQKQRAALDGIVEKAKQNLKDVEQRNKALTKEYDEKFKALLERLPKGAK